jgi:hypothetical protein
MYSPLTRSLRLPGAQRGSLRATALYLLWIVVLLNLLSPPVRAQNFADVTTYHNDNARTGQNLNETILTPANVNSTQFGLLFIAPTIDGYVYAQPLYLSNVTLPGQGAHNVVFVATEHDSVYAFDADTYGSPLWHVNFLSSGGTTVVSTVPNSDLGTGDIVPEIGITGTPVIDPKTGTLYLVAKTKETTGTTSTYVQRLHALDVTTGQECPGSPVVIQASVPGTGLGNSNGTLAFNALRENQRPALLLLNGIVYIAWASHGDIDPYHGWLIGYNATTLQQVAVFNTTPNGTRGGIWQGGGGPAADSSGNIYFMTGNGTFSAPNLGTGIDYGDSFLKLSTSGGLSVLDWFTPYNESTLEQGDADLGAGGVLLLPDSVGSNAHQHLMVGSGKQGTIYLVDRGDGSTQTMGEFTPNVNNNLQTLTGQIGGT